jgi:DNA-binding XRE family transcriptional regulator
MQGASRFVKPDEGLIRSVWDDATIVYRQCNTVAATLPPMLGEELRGARERAGLTQEELSFRAGFSRPYISQLERDLKSPTVAALFRICDALEIKASDLIGRVENRKAGGKPA